MNDFIVGDTIQCKDVQDATRTAKAIAKAGYIWDCTQDFKTQKYIITILGKRRQQDND